MWPNDNDSNNENKDNSIFSLDFGTNSDGTLGSWFDNTLYQVQNLLNDKSQLLKPFNELSSVFTGDSQVAFRAPSITQYDACLSKDGRSVWTEDGIWRCLFKGQSPPSHLKHEFKDLTGFLNYQRGLLQKKREEDEARRNQLSGPISSLSSGLFNSEPSFPGSQRPRLISEEEAQGKKVVWQSENSEAITLDDGSTQTRTRLVKYFDDGTATMKQTNDSGSNSSSKNWFWK